MANLITTSDLSLPAHMATGLFKEAAEGSSVALLSSAKPMLFGEHEFMDFSIGEAEFVSEGGQKSNTGITDQSKRAYPYKAQITVRTTEEVKWADEDYQLQFLQSVSDQMAPKLGRALDLGILHGLNPATGTRVSAMTEYVGQTSNSVDTGTGTALEHLDDGEQLLLGANPPVVPNGLAVDPAYAGKLRQRQPDLNGNPTPTRMFPDFQLGMGVSNVDGLRASVNNTVGALGITSGNSEDPTNIVGFMGDWTAIYWGVQRRVGLKLIEFGDPDGEGDLQRHNEIAIRAEVVYGWVIREVDEFVKLTVS